MMPKPKPGYVLLEQNKGFLMDSNRANTSLAFTKELVRARISNKRTQNHKMEALNKQGYDVVMLTYKGAEMVLRGDPVLSRKFTIRGVPTQEPTPLPILSLEEVEDDMPFPESKPTVETTEEKVQDVTDMIYKHLVPEDVKPVGYMLMKGHMFVTNMEDTKEHTISFAPNQEQADMYTSEEGAIEVRDALNAEFDMGVVAVKLIPVVIE